MRDDVRTPGGRPAASRLVSFKDLQDAIDLAVMLAAFALALLLRFDFEPPSGALRNAAVHFPCVLLVQCLALRITGVRAFVWRYTGLPEARAFIIAGGLALAPL